MEKLAYVGKILTLEDIPNSDNISQATVVCGSGGIWKGVVKKGELSVGSLAEVYMQDCILPKEERFAFLEKRKYRISICRFRGALSEVLIIPLTVSADVGSDISDVIKVTKFEKNLDMKLQGDAIGVFPNFIPRTDEDNFQRVPEMVQALVGKPFYASIKCDGSSETIYWDPEMGEVIACSRGLKKKPDENSIWYKTITKHNLKEVLKDSPYALQGELVGPKIQKNPMGLSDHEFRLFDVYNIGSREYLCPTNMISFAKQYNLITVPVIECGNNTFDMDRNTMIAYAEKQTYSTGKPAEGVVLRNLGNVNRHERISFKVISPIYGN